MVSKFFIIELMGELRAMIEMLRREHGDFEPMVFKWDIITKERFHSREEAFDYIELHISKDEGKFVVVKNGED